MQIVHAMAKNEELIKSEFTLRIVVRWKLM